MCMQYALADCIPERPAKQSLCSAKMRSTMSSTMFFVVSFILVVVIVSSTDAVQSRRRVSTLRGTRPGARRPNRQSDDDTIQQETRGPGHQFPVHSGLGRPSRTSAAGGAPSDAEFDRRGMEKRTRTCSIVHFPQPFENVYCCHKTPDCECSRRMGICADDIDKMAKREVDIN